VTAFQEAWRAGLFKRVHWPRNIMAGLVVGVVAIPLAMAFAIASGARPEQGLYTGIVAGLAVSLFGGTRVQIAGPTGAFVVLLASVTARYGLGGLQIATIMAGAMLVVFGLTKLGGVIRFIPDPVILGFTSGIGVVIWVGQWPSFFGIASPAGEHFHQKLGVLLGSLGSLHPATALVGLASLVVLIVWPRIPGARKIPAPLVALIGATIAQVIFRFEGVATIGTAFGGIPLGLPRFAVPGLSSGIVLELLWPAFTIALLGSIESLLSATVADGMAGTRHDSNQELIGQGIANVASGLLGGFAATGALARTATNVRNGGNSPLAGVVHALLLLLVVIALAPLAANVPLAALAAILFVVAWNMSEADHFVRTVKRAPRADVAIMLITFGLTIFADLVIAVNIGVILAMLNFMHRMSSSVEVRQLDAEEVACSLPIESRHALPEGVVVYTIDGPFFFGAAEQFESALVHTHTEPSTVVINLERVPFVDMTGLESLREVAEKFERRHIRVAFCGANARVASKLEKAGLLEIAEGPAVRSLTETLEVLAAESGAAGRDDSV